MDRLTLLLVLVSIVVNVNARAFENTISAGVESDENVVTYQVLSNKPLSIVSADDDSQHEYKLGQVGGLGASVKNPN
ncbi:unnamed protein product, partial [Rotaria magnacalcarata]